MTLLPSSFYGERYYGISVYRDLETQEPVFECREDAAKNH